MQPLIVFWWNTKMTSIIQKCMLFMPVANQAALLVSEVVVGHVQFQFAVPLGLGPEKKTFRVPGGTAACSHGHGPAGFKFKLPPVPR
jgi:hypothetical protein